MNLRRLAPGCWIFFCPGLSFVSLIVAATVYSGEFQVPLDIWGFLVFAPMVLLIFIGCGVLDYLAKRRARMSFVLLALLVLSMMTISLGPLALFIMLGMP